MAFCIKLNKNKYKMFQNAVVLKVIFPVIYHFPVIFPVKVIVPFR